MATKRRVPGLTHCHRRVTPWRELTRHCSLRPGGASLLAQTLRSEQGGDRSRAQWSRLAPPPPLFHLTHGLRRRALGCSRQGEGCTIELDSSSLAPGVGKWGGSGGGRIGWSFPLLYGCVNRLDWQSVACAHAHDMYFRLLGSQVGRLGSLLGEENKNFSEALEKTKILSLPSSIEPVNLSTCQRILSENGLTG